MRSVSVWRLLVIVSGISLSSRAVLAQTAAPLCSPACAAPATCVEGVCTAAVVPAAPAPPPAPRPLWREGKIVMPFLGINSFQGDRATNLGLGLRVGTLLGSRVSEHWSLNAELAFDVVNADAPPGETDHGYMLDLAFAPLVHLAQQKVELVLGPILGPWFFLDRVSGSGISANAWSAGWVLGANAGVLFPVSDKARVGGLISFASRNPVALCTSGTGVTEQCTTSGLHAANVLAFTAAALF
jgi:hypothetical protein